MIISPKTRNNFLLFSIVWFLSFPGFSTSFIWDGGKGDGNWSSNDNWNPNNVPDMDGDITIDCWCTVFVSENLTIDGSMTIAAGTTLDMGGNELEIGKNDNNATLTNNGTITNSSKIKAKGTGRVPEGPFITNTGNISTLKFDVGNNNGGGVVTNTAAGIINVTNTVPQGPEGIDESLHVDGTLCNEGIINVILGATFHGGILKCGGVFNATTIEFEEGKGLPAGGGATGGASDIQSQSFSDGAGCSGANSSFPIYNVIGGVGGGPNGDDTYTYQELFDEFGLSDGKQFSVDPDLVFSCGEANSNTSPEISNMPEDITAFVPDNMCELAINWTPPTITDDDGIQSIYSSHKPGDIFQIGSTTVTYTATDLSGNATSKSFNVTVVDITDPIIANIPEDISVYTPSNACNKSVNWIPPTITDNCNLQITTSSHNPGDVFPVGATTITYSASDASGNLLDTTFTITVIDTISPTINNLPADISQNADVGSCEAVVNWTAPTAGDNCLVSLTSDHNPGDFFPIGITMVTYTATDLSGNATSKSFNVTVVDITDPVIANIPEDISAYTPSNACNKSVNWIPPTITDDCNLQITTSSHNPGDVFPVGATTITYSASDASGNLLDTTFTITVIDTISPTINNLPADISQNADVGSCEAVVNWTAPTAGDNCLVSLTSDHNPGDFFPIGITMVTYTATDLSGNATSKSFNVTVVDENPPVFSFCPSSSNVITVDTTAKKSVIIWEIPIVEDECSSVSMSSNYNPGEAFDFGISTVIYTAIDLSGNVAQCRFDIKAGINLPPVVNNQNIYVKAGEPIDIQMEVIDPEGDQVFIESIVNNEDNSTINNIDRENFRFAYTSSGDFYGVDTVKVTFIDTGLPAAKSSTEVIVEVERNIQIEVSSAITSNGDFINDVLYIKNIDVYPSNSVQIFDRWGGLHYKTSGYDNESVVWDGKSDQRNLGNTEFVPTGTYFFVIDLGTGGKSITGAIEVIR